MTDVVVVFAGLPGKLARICAQAVHDDEGLALGPIALASARSAADVGRLEFTAAALPGAPLSVELVAPDAHASRLRELRDSLAGPDKLVVVVDCTGSAAGDNAVTVYCPLNIPFVVASTGYDLDAVRAASLASSTHFVAAPNLCKQIVALQAALTQMGQDFAGSYAGFELSVRESHQKAKADVSGTALAMLPSLAALTGAAAPPAAAIDSVRDEERQVQEVGVPREYLGGHGFHRYELRAPDGSVSVAFEHNICGRDAYGPGCCDVVRFLSQKAKIEQQRLAWSMVDVLKSGAMH